MAALFLTLDQAKNQLRQWTPVGDPSETWLTLEMQMAEARILNYLSRDTRGQTFVDGWKANPTTLPDDVRGAMLYLLGELDAARGDVGYKDPGPPRSPDKDLPDPVLGILTRYAGPVIA